MRSVCMRKEERRRRETEDGKENERSADLGTERKMRRKRGKEDEHREGRDKKRCIDLIQ